MTQTFRKEETVYLKGIVKWCKHTRPDSQYNKWSVVMYIEGPELDKVREWQAMGIKNKVQKDEADGWFITLSRRTSITVKGREVGLAPPRVVDPNNIPIEKPIGNGSAGVAKCVLWMSKNYPGKNLRWEALRIDNLVEFVPERDFVDGGEGLKELQQQTPEEFF